MRIALDTNVLVYAEGVNGAAIQQTALDLIIDQTHTLMQAFAIPVVYGCQPKVLSSPL